MEASMPRKLFTRAGRLLVILGALTVVIAASWSPALASSGSIPATLYGVAPLGKSMLAVGADQQFFATSPPSGLPLTETLRSSGKFKALKTGPAHSLITLQSVASTSSRAAWAVGYRVSKGGNVQTVSERWNGRRWISVKTPSPGQNASLSAVTVAKRKIWAFGQTQANNSAPTLTLIMEFTGGSWHVVPSPSPSSLSQNLYSATADSAGNVWAVGFFQNATDFSNQAFTVVNRGGGFQAVDTPSPGGANGTKLEAVTRVGGRLMAVGQYFNATPNAQTLTELWSGSSWQVVPSPSPGSADNMLDGVTTAKGKVWAVGWFANSKCDRSLTERFSGGSWRVVASPNVGRCSAGRASNLLNAVAASKHGTLYAVGVRDIRTLIERNSGRGWKVVKSAN
jgi:hypothetical protein